MSSINDQIYIGGWSHAENLQFLLGRGITHILCSAAEMKPNFPLQFIYNHIPLRDEPYFDIFSYLDQAADFILKAAQSGGKVLVHCAAGVSRSASFVIAYFIKYFGMTYEQALKHCQSCRPQINPNFGFERQLKQFYYKQKNKDFKCNNNQVENATRIQADQRKPENFQYHQKIAQANAVVNPTYYVISGNVGMYPAAPIKIATGENPGLIIPIYQNPQNLEIEMNARIASNQYKPSWRVAKDRKVKEGTVPFYFNQGNKIFYGSNELCHLRPGHKECYYRNDRVNYGMIN